MSHSKTLFFSVLLLTLAYYAYAGVGCGRQSPGNEPHMPSRNRIIGGTYAKRFSWPWIVSNQVRGGHFCGGSLLRVRDNVEASDIVLTAAHCVGPGKTNDPENYRDWTVAANLYWQSYNSDAEIRNVVKAVHHDYSPIKNDIAVLKLDKPIKFTENIRPVCLPRQGDPIPTGKVCVAAGWGRNNSQDLYMSPDILQQTGAPAQSAQSCSSIWGSANYVESQMICAGAMDGSSATCNGDSGGPLVCQESDGRWVQYGAVSYGVAGSCLVKGYPPVFARVSSYVDWIQARIRELSSL